MTNLITEARELCEDVTPGQWKRHDTADYAEIHNGDTWGKDLSPIALVGHTDDANFIARSRTLIPELCDALEKAQAQVPRWISSTERLPEIGVPVLVRQKYSPREYGEVTIGRWYQPYDKRRRPYWKFIAYCCDEIVYSDHTDFICPGRDFVTHWMPLPELPEEGAKQSESP